MRIAICDDEKRICAILAEKVGKICPDAETITYASGKELLNAGELPDILLLALVLLVVIENVLLFLEIFISEKIYIRKSEWMEWRELTLLASPYVAIIAGYWICSFLSDAYVNETGVYVWNNYPIYDGISALFGIIAFLATVTVMHSYQRMKQSQEDALQNALVSKQVEELSGHVHTIEGFYGRRDQKAAGAFPEGEEGTEGEVRG